MECKGAGESWSRVKSRPETLAKSSCIIISASALKHPLIRKCCSWSPWRKQEARAATLPSARRARAFYWCCSLATKVRLEESHPCNGEGKAQVPTPTPCIVQQVWATSRACAQVGLEWLKLWLSVGKVKYKSLQFSLKAECEGVIILAWTPPTPSSVTLSHSAAAADHFFFNPLRANL